MISARSSFELAPALQLNLALFSLRLHPFSFARLRIFVIDMNKSHRLNPAALRCYYGHEVDKCQQEKCSRQQGQG